LWAIVISIQQRHPPETKTPSPRSTYLPPPPPPTFPEEEDPIIHTPLVSLSATQTDHDVTFPLRTPEVQPLTIYVHLPRVYLLMKGSCAQFIQHSQKVDVVRAGLKTSVHDEQNACRTTHYRSCRSVLHHWGFHPHKKIIIIISPPPPWRCGPTRAMASSFSRFLDHTQRRGTVGRTSLDE